MTSASQSSRSVSPIVRLAEGSVSLIYEYIDGEARWLVLCHGELRLILYANGEYEDA